MVSPSPSFASAGCAVESFRLDDMAWRSAHKQQLLTQEVLCADGFLRAFDALVTQVVLPQMKQWLVTADAGAYSHDAPVRFFYQRPPTLRLQRGPSDRAIQRHRDAQYGHQAGELNFWMPLSPLARTNTTLWVESAPDADDFHPLLVDVGQIGVFHGTSCRHYVPPNASRFTRVSLDFRVGVEGCFDPTWVFAGTRSDHSRAVYTV